MSSDKVKELLRQGIEAAKASKREEARRLFQEVVDLDEENERGWFWLATVVDNDEERRICLLNVLRINPNNERAQQALNKLDERRKQAEGEKEVIAGFNRRQLMLLLGLAAAVVVVALLLYIITNNNARSQQAEQTRQALAPTQTLIAAGTQTAVAEASQEVQAAAETATALAINSPTPSPTSTSFLPDLPTATPTPTDPANIPTLPPPEGLTGRIFGWSGRDVDNDGYLNVAVYSLANVGQVSLIEDIPARYADYSARADRILFTRYYSSTFDVGLQFIAPGGRQAQNLSQFWAGSEGIIRADHASFSPDGNRIVFVALKRGKRELFVLDLAGRSLGGAAETTPDPNAPEGSVPPLLQLSSDGAQYSYPSWSPDGSKIVVVRDPSEDPQQIVEPDLVVIDVATGAQSMLAPNGSAFFETWPRFSPDGRQIVFAATASRDPNDSDILMMNADGTGAQTTLVGGEGINEIYPIFSPDGAYLAYAANPTGLQYDIFILNLATSETTQLTPGTREDDFPSDWAAE